MVVLVFRGRVVPACSGIVPGMRPPDVDESIWIGLSSEPSGGGPVDDEELRPSIWWFGDGGGGSSVVAVVDFVDFFLLAAAILRMLVLAYAVA